MCNLVRCFDVLMPLCCYMCANHFIFFRPLTSYNKRESCASSATTTTLLGPPSSNYVSQRGSNGALHLYAMPRAISPMMQVKTDCNTNTLFVRMETKISKKHLIEFEVVCVCVCAWTRSIASYLLCFKQFSTEIYLLRPKLIRNFFFSFFHLHSTD